MGRKLARGETMPCRRHSANASVACDCLGLPVPPLTLAAPTCAIKGAATSFPAHRYEARSCPCSIDLCHLMKCNATTMVSSGTPQSSCRRWPFHAELTVPVSLARRRQCWHHDGADAVVVAAWAGESVRFKDIKFFSRRIIPLDSTRSVVHPAKGDIRDVFSIRKRCKYFRISNTVPHWRYWLLSPHPTLGRDSHDADWSPCCTAAPAVTTQAWSSRFSPTSRPQPCVNHHARSKLSESPSPA